MSIHPACLPIHHSNSERLTMDDEALRAMLPMGFGKQSKAQPAKKQPTSAPAAAAAAGPSRPSPPPAKVAQREDDGDEEEDDGLTAEERAAQAELPADNDDDDSDSDGSVDLGPEPATVSSSSTSTSLPTTSHVLLTSHTKPLSALSIDSSGARLITGGYDYALRLWDFGGMTSSFSPFKKLDEPFGSYWLHDVCWSPKNDSFLAAAGTSQAKLFDREGNEVGMTAKGDPYLRDMKQTKGHVAPISSCAWLGEKTFLTGSADSTVRVWDTETCRLGQKTVINVRSKERGARTSVTAIALSSGEGDGGKRTLAAACADGALHLWTMGSAGSGSYSKPNATVLQAHKPGTETSSIVFSRDGRTLATRGGPGDDSVKLWDLRNFKVPLVERKGLPNDYAQTDIIFSPDEATLLTGVAGKGIEVLSRKDLSTVSTIPLPSSAGSNASVIRLAWHSRINQILATTSTGHCLVYYSPTASIRGALLALPKTSSRSRARSPSDFMETVGPIITPGASSSNERGQGQSAAAKRRRMDKAAASDPRIPQRPMVGVGKGGRIGMAANPNRAQEDDVKILREDPREALLKFAEGEKRFTKAWEENQPETLYEREAEGDGEEKG